MVGILMLVAISLLPLAAHAASPYPSLSTNCTETTSKSASWFISNFTVDTDTKFDYGPGTSGKVSFSIKNTANGYSFNCLQGDGSTGRRVNRYLVDGKVWYSCNVFCAGARGQPREDNPPLDTSFNFDIKTKALSISQTWGCSNGAGWNKTMPNTNYTGTGSSVISALKCTAISGGRPDQVSCSPVDVTVKASNVSIAISRTGDEADEDSGSEPYMGGGAPLGPNPFAAPIIPKPAILPSTAGCSKLSTNTSWGISNFYWSTGGISFTLKNNALDYTQRCSINGISSSVETRLQSPQWWNCTRFDSMHVNYPANEVFTRIRYGGPKNVLGINESWYCNDEDAAKPTVYSVYGEANFPIKCRETKFCHPPGRYDPEDTYELEVQGSCNADDLTITPSKTDTFHVSKEDAIQDFKPRGYNCTSKSLDKGAWEITDFWFNRTYVPANTAQNITASYTGAIEFYYNNTATDNDWPRNENGLRQCLYVSDDIDNDIATANKVDCLMSFEPFRLGFQFDNKMSTITLRQGWNCDGVDGQHTNYFTATGSSPISLQCQTVGMDTKCTVGKRLTVPIANVISRLNSNQTSPFQYVPGS